MVQRIPALGTIILLTASLWAAPPPDATTEAPPMHAVIAQEAEAIRSLIASTFGRQYLDAAVCLPPVEERVVYRRQGERMALSVAQYEAATEEARTGYEPTPLDETFYYTTRYGTPIANARTYDIAGAHGLAGPGGARVCDFGFGSIGSLRMLASLGAHAVGIEIDDMLRALYVEPGDTGSIPLCSAAPPDSDSGTLTLAFGQWPGDDDVRTIVTTAARGAGAGGFDLFISKNTLKRGYIHPTRAFRSRAVGEGLIDLGVSDETFVRQVHASLADGGLFLIYNLSPKLIDTDEAYIPWADGRCPFGRKLLDDIGFEVIAFDVDDTPLARLMAHALSWDQRGMDIDGTLFGLYTLLRKRE